MIIISGEKTNESRFTNIVRSNQLRQLLINKGYTIKDCLGKYKGRYETSFIVNNNDVDSLCEIAKQFEQESILYIDDISRTAYLISPDGKARFIGVWKQVIKEEADKMDGFTCVNNVFYGVK